MTRNLIRTTTAAMTSMHGSFSFRGAPPSISLRRRISPTMSVHLLDRIRSRSAGVDRRLARDIDGIFGHNGTMATSSETGSSAFRTSPSLLLRVQANDQIAWTRLVDLYAPLVYHWCRRAQLGPEDTGDVFQETFRAVSQHIHAFRRDRPGDSFRGWLRTITQNKIRDHFRRIADEPRGA